MAATAMLPSTLVSLAQRLPLSRDTDDRPPVDGARDETVTTPRQCMMMGEDNTILAGFEEVRRDVSDG